MRKSIEHIAVLTLAVALTSVMIALLIGCSSPITNEKNTETSEFSQTQSDAIDELWIIHPQQGLRTDLTIDEVQRIIEENIGLFTIDGIVDIELLKQFIRDTFGEIELIDDEDAIIEILKKVSICCTYDPKTGTVKIRIFIKNR